MPIASPRRFCVCVHDATPAFARETDVIVRELAPLLGRRLSCGVVPNWHGQWPIPSHRAYCEQLRERCEEILLHGFFHRRGRGRGPVTLLVAGDDEMNGLDAAATVRMLERGQQVIADVFGEHARGFVAPAWQRGHVDEQSARGAGFEYVMGFFSVRSQHATVLLATSSWDCGRWGWLGHVGGGIGRLLRWFGPRVPTLAIHPRDLERGYWPAIVRLARSLMDAGFEPATPSELLRLRDAAVRV